MEIIIGKTAGFCHGIINAVKKAKELLNENEEVLCSGELAHNRQVMEELEKNGLRVIDSIYDVKKDQKLVIRPHGAKKETYDIASKNNIKLIDLTCVKVLTVHDIAKDYAHKPNYIFLLGEKNHPETDGTYSFCGKNSCIIEEVEEIESAMRLFHQSRLKKILIIAQTTFSMEKFDHIVKIIQDQLKQYNGVEIEINKTICNATRLRQQETSKIAKNVDMMIVIGGKNSSNTRKLYEISKNNCENVIFIQTRKDIIKKDIMGYSKIGIMAGASTPKESIDGVIEFIQEEYKN